MAITLNYSDIELAEFNETAYNNLWLQQINQSLQDLDNRNGRLQYSMAIPFPTDAEAYLPLMDTRFPLTVRSVTLKTNAGTCTVAVKINGTDVTSLDAISVTSTQSTTLSTGANTMAIGDDLTITPSSVSGVDWLYVNVWCDRTGAGTA